MSKLGKKISMEILNKYNGGWIKFYEFNNLTLITGVELNHIKYDGNKVNYIMEIVIYNNVTKKIIYCTGNNLRITDESDVYMNLDELLIFIYYTYDQEKGRFMAGAETIIDGFIYDFNTIKINSFVRNRMRKEKEVEIKKAREEEENRLIEENKNLYLEAKNKLEGYNLSIIKDRMNHILIIELKNLTNEEIKNKEMVLNSCIKNLIDKKLKSEFINRYGDKFNIKYLSEIALTLKEENELYKNILNN